MAQTMKWGQQYSVLLDVGAVANAFTLDSSTLDGTMDVLDGSTNFVDATEYVLSVSIKRGRQSQIDNMQVGICQATFDDRLSGRLFDPANTASTWYSDGLNLAPRRNFKVLAGTAELFVGKITDLDIQYEMPNLSFCSITAADGLYELSRTTLLGFNPSEQLTSARVTSILDRTEVGYSTALRSIETGVATCGTVAYADNTNVLAALQNVAVAEDGRLYANRKNQVTFNKRIFSTFSTAVKNFGGTAASSVPMTGISVGYGQETLFNRVSIGVDGFGTAQVVSDATSQTQFGVQSYSLDNVPLATQAAGSALAANILAKYKNPVFRFDEISTSLQACGTAIYSTLVTLDVGDIVSVTKTYQTGLPLSKTDNVYIESVSHDITPQDHRIRFGLGQANVLTNFILDTSTLDNTLFGLG
jgi:hypothetical protein